LFDVIVGVKEDETETYALDDLVAGSLGTLRDFSAGTSETLQDFGWTVDLSVSQIKSTYKGPFV
jgi:hypothetical protein